MDSISPLFLRDGVDARVFSQKLELILLELLRFGAVRKGI